MTVFDQDKPEPRKSPKQMMYFAFWLSDIGLLIVASLSRFVSVVMEVIRMIWGDKILIID